MKYGVLSTFAADEDEAKNIFEVKVSRFNDLDGFKIQIGDPKEINLDPEKKYEN